MMVFRSVLSKEDKEHIAQYAKKSYRTVEAVLNGDRSNDQIETAIFNRSRIINLKLADAIMAVELANEARPVSLSSEPDI